MLWPVWGGGGCPASGRLCACYSCCPGTPWKHLHRPCCPDPPVVGAPLRHCLWVLGEDTSGWLYPPTLCLRLTQWVNPDVRVASGTPPPPCPCATSFRLYVSPLYPRPPPALPLPPTLATAPWLPPDLWWPSTPLRKSSLSLHRWRQADQRDAAPWCLTKTPHPYKGWGRLTCCCRAVSDSDLPPLDAVATNVALASPAARVPWDLPGVSGTSLLDVGGSPSPPPPHHRLQTPPGLL